LEKVILTYSNFRGGKQSQSAKRVKKMKKQLAGSFGENLKTKDFIEAMAHGKEGVT
jgi:hypothetical protein